MKRSEKQRRKGKIFPFECRVQRIARRDKKAFLHDQCKEIEENNRIGKTRDLYKKIRDTKGTFHAKMGLIKDRNGMDISEAEDIKNGGKNSHKDRMVLAQRHIYRSMDQNRKPRDKSTSIWSPYLRQRRQGYTMGKK